jgi:hypothetical protein
VILIGELDGVKEKKFTKIANTNILTEIMKNLAV